MAFNIKSTYQSWRIPFASLRRQQTFKHNLLWLRCDQIAVCRRNQTRSMDRQTARDAAVASIRNALRNACVNQSINGVFRAVLIRASRNTPWPDMRRLTT